LPEDVAKLVESGAQIDQLIEALKGAKLKSIEENGILIVTKGKQEIARLVVNSDGTVQPAKGQPAEPPSEEDSEE
jgi:hypothetical protein